MACTSTDDRLVAHQAFMARGWRAARYLQQFREQSRLPEPALIGAIKGSAPRSGATSLRSLRLLRTSIDHVEPTAAQIRCAYRRSLDCSQALARPRSGSAPGAVGGEHDLAHASAPPICRRVTQPSLSRAREYQIVPTAASGAVPFRNSQGIEDPTQRKPAKPCGLDALLRRKVVSPIPGADSTGPLGPRRWK